MTSGSDSIWLSACVGEVREPLRGQFGYRCCKRRRGGLEGGIAPAAGASPMCCPGLSLGFPLRRGTVLSKSGVCLNCYILAGAERQEEIPDSTPSYSSMSKAPFLPASVPTYFFENNSPCPADSFANIPSPTTYKMRFHRHVTEVKLISHLHGEAVSGGALQG